MKSRSLLLSTAFALVSVCSAHGQEMVDGNSVDAILEIARGYGTAKLAAQSNGDPEIRGVMEGIRYVVYFLNCTDNTACADINFYTGFQDIKPGFEVMNEWNATKRFGKAYIDNVGDVTLEWDINLEQGISHANLDASFVLWGQLMDQFSRYVGWQ